MPALACPTHQGFGIGPNITVAVLGAGDSYTPTVPGRSAAVYYVEPWTSAAEVSKRDCSGAGGVTGDARDLTRRILFPTCCSLL